ncbi:phytanoyl-CoA dioxygenase family protein [Marinoscillum furvescens]|uniref:Phytanoyl-CoA dioxygenase PhyH n=1 Tax=Marinoscillum furvescens DSM 4134 TaxID=1122208 RepID=A0A3D9L8M7_MARFU|nr:phytanoyl-CoA dioxygenase family protein [Marinoscillum furvescens]REE02026.1 phytanoyl-CoA dioxygenase PhyH [Marinoscillum furvescens DSM 4134]
MNSSSFSAYTCSADDLKHYQEHGYVVLRTVFSSTLAQDIKSDIDHIMSVIGLGHTKLRQTQQYLKGSTLDAYINSQLLKSIASQLMGGEATMYLPFSAVKSGGGGGKFHFHQDNQYTTFEGPGINIWAPFVTTSEKNGALQVVPGSHKMGDLQAVNAGEGDHHLTLDFEPEDFQVLDMEPGDVVAFDRLTVHGSGPNDTNDNRVAYAVQFHRNDVIAEVNGQRVKLLDHPRWTDIHGVTQIQADEVSGRDGH